MKSICVVGVDGTGKSSTTELLRQHLGAENAEIQYMGTRQWTTRIAKKYHEGNRSNSFFNSFMTIVSHIYEMYYRVNKHRNSKKIVIFDRYVYEQVVIRKRTGIKNKVTLLIYVVFLKWLFYKPDITFYLTCPIDVSISRKNDITTQKALEGLRRNKLLLDSYYMNCPDIMVIDTSIHHQEDVLGMMIKAIHTSLNI